MILTELISDLKVNEKKGNLNIDISGISYDSRRVQKNHVFVAVPGLEKDGSHYIPEAVANGALCIISESSLDWVDDKIVKIVVPSARIALACLANKFFDYPSRKLKVVGVTGTKGKTTASYLIDEIFNSAGFVSGIIGTVESRIKGRAIPSKLTTPESLDLQGLLAHMIKADVTHVTMEVTSHALALDRIYGTEFNVAVHTNITHDHLDFHGTVDKYAQAKIKLFDYLNKGVKNNSIGIVNVDDEWAGQILKTILGKKLTYGIEKSADIIAEDIYVGLLKMSFTLKTPNGSIPIRSDLFGMFNVYNMLAAAAAGIAFDIDLGIIKKALEKSRPVPGRFEQINVGQDFKVIVDFAHTADSLQKLLETARNITKNKIILVFGCPGDRDRTKRPIMGTIAANTADFSIISTDNPHREEPARIIDEIENGLISVGGIEGKNYLKIEGRKTAIRKAIEMASKDDTVIIAGRGHEKFQDFSGIKIELDDRETAREYCERRVRDGI